MWAIYILSCAFAGFAFGIGSGFLGLGFTGLALVSCYLAMESRIKDRK